MKLTPNVTDVTEIARAAVSAGADALSLINTLLGMAVDAERRRPVLARGVGGLSGPAVKPVALRMVWEVHKACLLYTSSIGFACVELLRTIDVRQRGYEYFGCADDETVRSILAFIRGMLELR